VKERNTHNDNNAKSDIIDSAVADNIKIVRSVESSTIDRTCRVFLLID